MRAALGQRLRRQLITATRDQATQPQPEPLLDTNRYIPLRGNILLCRYRNNIIRISCQSDSCATIRKHSILNHSINSPPSTAPESVTPASPATNSPSTGTSSPNTYNRNKTVSKTLHWCITLHDNIMALKVQSLLPSGSLLLYWHIYVTAKQLELIDRIKKKNMVPNGSEGVNSE